MGNSNGNKRVLQWALGMLATLITAGIIAAVTLGWTTSKAVATIQTRLDFVQEDVIQIEAKLDLHIKETNSSGGGG